MEGGYKYIGLALVFGLAQVCYSGKPIVEKIKTNLGGAECVDPEDCSNNGICQPGSNGKGVCCCVVGFAGANCDTPDKDAKSPPRPMTTTTQVKENGLQILKKRSKLLNTSDASKRALNYDTKSNLLGLTPEVVAIAQQPVLIYNPSSNKYLFVSKDVKATGVRNAYVEVREDRLGERSPFLIKKVPNKQNKYYIFNIQQNSYVYVSNSKSGVVKHWNNNVLASTGNPGKGTEESKYIFEFEDEDGDGFYKIKNQGKYVYVSRHRHGVPSYPLVKAATSQYLIRSETQFFQLTLRENAKNIKFTVTGDEKREVDPLTLVDGAQCSKICYEGDPKKDSDQDASVKYSDASKESRTYTKTHGFSVSADTSGLTAIVGKLTFTYKYDQTTTDVTENTKTVEKSLSVKVRPQQCVCIEVTFQSITYTRPFALEATSKENKVIKATGTIEGNRLANFDAHTKMFDFKKGFKCPHEA